MCSVAFKEWAAVCRALASGRQSLILRKGGIAEADGAFRPEYDTFLPYPTYFHETQVAGLKPETAELLAAAEADRPVAGMVTFRHVVTVTDTFHLGSLESALRLDPFHVWATDAVTKRFHYRTPGLYALVVRVCALPHAVTVPEEPSYAGCKSWVPLVSPVPTDRAVPVLDDDSFRRTADAIRAAVA